VINCDKSGYQGYQGVNCDGIKGYQDCQGYLGADFGALECSQLPVISHQSSGYVSLFHLPTKHESGSYAQISNEASGNSVFNYPNFFNYHYFSYYSYQIVLYQKLKVHIDERFEHVFSLIRLTGAEIWPVKGSRKI
jgi:hypothetical protein